MFGLAKAETGFAACWRGMPPARWPTPMVKFVGMSNTDTVVLGGGVVADGWLLGKAGEMLNPTHMRFVTNGVVLTELDADNIGLIGAGIEGLTKYEGNGSAI